jgi:AraC-like DNA-binding protein
MISSHLSEDRFASLPFPLTSPGQIQSLDPTTLFSEGKEFFGGGVHSSKTGGIRPQADASVIQVGDLKLLATRTTPCLSTEEGTGFSTLSMSYAGDTHEYKDGKIIQTIEPGDVHLSPRTGGIANVGYFSGIICQIEHSRLKRTIRAMKGEDTRIDLGEPYVFHRKKTDQQGAATGHLWAHLSYVDQVLRESDDLAAGLALDDQIYRLLAVSVLQAEGGLEKAQKRLRLSTNNWTHPLDNLVDYIRANAHLNITLTDLEEQSHYSARHLQNLFKEKFSCTPMQFIRRERLSAAMEKLQTADHDDTVTKVARACGYRFISNFTTDFQREFGVAPSVVLRASRGPAT